MKDLKDRNLYREEEHQYRTFLQKKLKTKEQADEIVLEQADGGDNVLDVESFIGGSPIDVAGDDELMDSFNWGDDDEGESKGRERMYTVSEDNLHERGSGWQKLVFSPFILLMYVSKQVVMDTPNREDFISVLKTLNKVTIISTIGAFLLWLMDFKFVFNLGFQSVMSLIMFILSMLTLKYVYKEEIELPFMKKKEEEDAEGMDDDIGDFGDGLLDEIEERGQGIGYPSIDGLEEEEDDFLLNFMEDDEPSEEDYYIEEGSRGSHTLPPSPVQVGAEDGDEIFSEGLMRVFKENHKYKGKRLNDRGDLVKSFTGYLIENDKAFGRWQEVPLRGALYGNLGYTLYKGLVLINPTFAKDDNYILVHRIEENPLMYKMEIELPAYYTAQKIYAKIHDLESFFREDERSEPTPIFITQVSGRFIIKIQRPYSGMITTGDILRYHDNDIGKTVFEEFTDSKYGLPLLVGLKNNEIPLIMDLEVNTSGAIVGTSGSGKSWLTFDFMANIFIGADYMDTQMVVFDYKNSPFWNHYSLSPHVIGYHTDMERYVYLFREIRQEVERRKKLLNEAGVENFKTIRKRLRKQGRYDELEKYSLLIIVIDEITTLMDDLDTAYGGNKDNDYYKEIRNILAGISQVGRSLGVRLITIGQRAEDKSIPKKVLMNCSYKFGMKVQRESEYNFLFGDETRITAPIPKKSGMALMVSEEITEVTSIKSLTLGGKGDEDVGQVIRVFALDVARRAIGRNDTQNQPKGMQLEEAYNRPMLQEKARRYLEEGRILFNDTPIDELRLEVLDVGALTSTGSSLFTPKERLEDTEYVSDTAEAREELLESREFSDEDLSVEDEEMLYEQYKDMEDLTDYMEIEDEEDDDIVDDIEDNLEADDLKLEEEIEVDLAEVVQTGDIFEWDDEDDEDEDYEIQEEAFEPEDLAELMGVGFKIVEEGEDEEVPYVYNREDVDMDNYLSVDEEEEAPKTTFEFDGSWINTEDDEDDEYDEDDEERLATLDDSVEQALRLQAQLREAREARERAKQEALDTPQPTEEKEETMEVEEQEKTDGIQVDELKKQLQEREREQLRREAQLEAKREAERILAEEREKLEIEKERIAQERLALYEAERQEKERLQREIENLRQLNQSEKEQESETKISLHYKEQEEKEVRLSIKQYIMSNGRKAGMKNRKILKKALAEEYPKEVIDQALDNFEIIEDGEYYKIEI